MITGYHPEMGEQRPAGDIEAKLCHSGKHWYLTTPLMLRGRGIRHTGTLEASDLTPQGQRKVGWHQYKVTDLAVSKLQTQYAMTVEMLL